MHPVREFVFLRAGRRSAQMSWGCVRTAGTWRQKAMMRAKILRQQFMKIVCAAACLIFVHLVCFGQVGTASLQGTVADQSGAVIAGAAVTVKNTQTGVTRVLKTDSQGRYAAPELQIGEYEVEAQSAGFQTGKRTGITLNVGDQRVADLKLAVGQASDVMVVTTGVAQ